MSRKRQRRRASRPSGRRRLEATVQAIQEKWGFQALHKGTSLTATPATPSLSTGLASLDRILAIGGLPLGHISELIGQPTSGKRTLALHILAQTQSRYPCLYIDLAQTFDPAYAAACHVDLAHLTIATPVDPVQALNLACDLAAAGHWGLIVFDSTAELLTASWQASESAAVLRRLRRLLSGKPTALLFLTPSFADGGQASGQARPESSLGLLYPPGFDLGQQVALRLSISRQRWLRQNGTIRGYEARVTVLRNRWGKEGVEVVVRMEHRGSWWELIGSLGSA